MMIQISYQAKIYVCIKPLDFRSGFNKTAAFCRSIVERNPLDGGLFIFINRKKTMIRCFSFDGHGEWLATKRIATGKFKWWDQENLPPKVVTEQVHFLLRGGDPSKANLPRPWKEIN